jgi:hypothetical protein
VAKTAEDALNKESILRGLGFVVAAYVDADMTEHVPPLGVTADFASLCLSHDYEVVAWQ